MLKHLNHKNNLSRQAVHDILAKYKTDSAVLFERYLADLHSDSVTKRYTAAFAIGRLPVIPERRVAVATELVALLDDNPGNLSDDVKKSTTAKARDHSGNALMALVDEEAKHPANAAMIALQQWGGPEIETAMVKQLASKYDDLRYGAVLALGKFGSRRAIAPLRALQTAEKVDIMADHCKEAIKEIEQREK